MLTSLAHHIAAQPFVYDRLQVLVGANRLRKQLSNFCAKAPLPYNALVIDVGGGTGAWRTALSPDILYVCLDIDARKLRHFRAKSPGAMAVQSDASRLPFAKNTVDAVLCVALTHHIQADAVDQVLGEAARVLKKSAPILLIDAIWEPTRRLGRLLWKYDRGVHPHTAETLISSVNRHFEIQHCERSVIFHEYVLCAASTYV